MAKITIQKWFPIPKGRRLMPGHGREAIYPWEAMEIGDSFRHPSWISTAWGAAYNATIRYAPKKFRAYRYQGYSRIWRTE